MTAKWGVVKKACEAHNLEVTRHGSEYKISGIAVDGQYRSLIIGHEWTRSTSTVVPCNYVAMLKRRFGLKDEDFRP